MGMVRVHRQALDMADEIARHLECHPEAGPLFMIDYERALTELGFQCSKGMRSHLRRQMPPVSEQARSVYDHVKRGGRLPFDLVVRMPKGSGRGDSAGKPRPSKSAPTPGPRESLGALPVHASLAPTMARRTTGEFPFVLQLTDALLNRIVTAFYDAGGFPTTHEGEQDVSWPELGIEGTARFSLALTLPILDFAAATPDTLGLTIGATGKLWIDVSILAIPFPTNPVFSDRLELDVSFSARVEAGVIVQPVASTQSAVTADLRSLTKLEVTVTSPTLPPPYLALIKAVLERVIATNLAALQGIPVTFAFPHDFRAHVPIRGISTRIIPGTPGVPGTLTIAFDLGSQPAGDRMQIANIVPGGNSFAVELSRGFLLSEAWPIAKANFHPPEKVTIRDMSLDMREGYFRLFVDDLEYDIPCLPDPTADVTARMRFLAFQQDGAWRTRLDFLEDPQIDLDIIDRLVYTLIGGLLFGAIGAIVVNVLIEILAGIASGQATSIGESFSVGFRGRIPGTSVEAEASTPIAPVIHVDSVYAYGDAVFRTLP